jgi:type II secretory pathway component GspD/PulD (secretin)
MRYTGLLTIITSFLLCTFTLQSTAQPGGKIQIGDLVHIEVYRVSELSQTVQVDTKGMITMSYAGSVKISGLAENDAAARISKALQKVMKNPRVTVTRSDYISSTPIKATGRTEEMVLEIIPLKNTNAESMYNVMQDMSSTGGSVSFHPDTNSLLITDTPSTIRNMKMAITQLDQMQSQLTQVQIAAKIVEVRVGAMKEFGVRWFAQGDHINGGFTPTQRQTPKANAIRGGLSPSRNEANASNNVGGGNGGSGGSTRSFLENNPSRRLNIPLQVPIAGQTFLGFVNNGIDLGVMLDVLVSEDEAELLANPVTLTVNHQPAHIEMVDKIPYNEFGTEITGASSFSTKFLDAGIMLDVTPHVYEDDQGAYVKLELKPEVSFPSGSNNGVPILSVRRSDTVANVRNGQTLVVGGILTEDQRNVETKLPWIGDLPIIGLLFKHKEKTKDRTELMIFVTPTIFQNPEDITWDKMLDSSSQLDSEKNMTTTKTKSRRRKE